MAKRFLLLLSPFLTILLLAVTVTESEAYATTTPYQGYKREKFTHLHFYFHDVISGDKPTAIRVAEAPGTNSSAIKFGVIMIADDPLTEGPDPSSKEVGRAQGMYASTDLKDLIFTMVFNLAFTEGQYNGSTLAMYGRNAIMTKLREMPIIGGTGAFRFARGYAQAQTYKLVDQDAVVEYNGPVRLVVAGGSGSDSGSGSGKHYRRLLFVSSPLFLRLTLPLPHIFCSFY